MTRFEFICDKAVSEEECRTNCERVWFQYFNANGLHAEASRLDEKLNELVDQGKAKSGALLAHGAFARSRQDDEISRLMQLKRVPSRALAVWKSMQQFHIEGANRFIQEKAA